MSYYDSIGEIDELYLIECLVSKVHLRQIITLLYLSIQPVGNVVPPLKLSYTIGKFLD